MAEILKGKEVVAAMKEKMIADVEALQAKGVQPTLAIVRVGERGDDISYEKGAMTRCKGIGVEVKNFVLPADATQEELVKVIDEVNADSSIHGCLLFRPLPKHIDENFVRNRLAPEKDVDGITDLSMAGTYACTELGYPPCTPTACMEILDHFGIDLTGKKVVVIGRSLVVGKPAAIMAIRKNGTVTVCHTKTKDMAAVCREADIVIACAGKAGVVGEGFFKAGQIVIDVGINFDEEGNMKGDVDFEAAEPVVAAITPVPGGVGTVTTSVLVKHVIEAAKKTVK
ncbi:MAG: bifunctional 5,10-methylenetetrahydrofolate dehydrogenase/5,10-methenyltetrahydrofolate cyclohydrolase [Oscillospiraceae bacterium]|jgi:methylenetetrahydrofolate dehydrogenase (NADP+)/methenyltetrahydrofolate cyclohydrolase|nr:bifunctional 5,10-methylenetetrahydrofolate dehydrogenase/5,10-methenyltetrahydrofolate cyclohydrolase [Oscillospiraceae bacterium]